VGERQNNKNMVYLVDDDADDLEIVQEALVQNSYKGPVLPLNNGQTLIDQLSINDLSPEPKVIILDLNMPLLNGFQALQHIRKHPNYGSIPVIVLTASSSKEDEIKSFELGCNFYMTKPTRMDEYVGLTNLVKKFTATRR
jgi:DNA-binding response OmpR family regulator